MVTVFAGLLAAASDPGSKIGDNIGKMLEGLAQPVYLGVVAVMAIGLLSVRKIASAAVFFIVALGVGILVFDSAGFASLVKSVGDAITRGV